MKRRDCPAFHDRLSAALEGIGLSWEVVYVNDGSRDTTLEVMFGSLRSDPRVAVVNLSRNFGKEIALTAGSTMRARPARWW